MRENSGMDTSPTRTCKKCGLAKPLDQFSAWPKDRRCRDCRNAYQREWKRKHPSLRHEILYDQEGEPLPKTCRRCRTLKPAREFWKDALQSDGLSQWCVECRQQYYEKTDYPIDTFVRERRCLKCERSLSISDFGRCRKAKGGYNHLCKWCIRDKQRASGDSGRRLRRIPPVFNLADIDKGYVAALLDGEGHIGLSHSSTSGYRIKVEITNTNLEVLRWLVERLGGRVNNHNKETSRSKASYRWTIAKFSAVHLLRYLLPVLIIKRGQADAAIWFSEMEVQYLEDNCRRLLPKPLPSEMQALIEDVTRLNHRGPTR